MRDRLGRLWAAPLGRLRADSRDRQHSAALIGSDHLGYELQQPQPPARPTARQGRHRLALGTGGACALADMAVCLFHTAFLAHLPLLDRERFEHLVVVLSTARPISWVQAEPRRDPAEPR